MIALKLHGPLITVQYIETGYVLPLKSIGDKCRNTSNTGGVICPTGGSRGAKQTIRAPHEDRDHKTQTSFLSKAKGNL